MTRGGPPRPAWLRKPSTLAPAVVESRARLAQSGLLTVCQSARCPNLSECYQAGNATFLIMGQTCTRRCGFCAVRQGPPVPLDEGEGRRIARYMADRGVRYAVITSVTRDDLPDGGAAHFARVVTDIRALLPASGLELLVPDFDGREESVRRAAALPVQVLGHNVETVPSLYGRARPGADYGRSLRLLRMARLSSAGARIKSGIMVGLGETAAELNDVFDNLAQAGVEILTIGQYLRPSWKNLPVERYVEPGEFDALAEAARTRGISAVLAGPYVRSSYLAELMHGKTEKNLTRGGCGNIISGDS